VGCVPTRSEFPTGEIQAEFKKNVFKFVHVQYDEMSQLLQKADFMSWKTPYFTVTLCLHKSQFCLYRVRINIVSCENTDIFRDFSVIPVPHVNIDS
jgi:hypothetical protein